MRSRAHVTCLLSVLILTLAAPAARADAKKVRTVEGITEYRLDNGLQLLLFPDPTKSTVTVNMTIFVGSRHEGYGEAGMAHLLEHMLFKGTPTHKNIPQLLQSRGAQYNASTWYDRTNYFEILPASEENLEFALKLEADRMVNSLIRREDLDSEFSVVRSEFERGENNPQQILRQRMMSAAYLWHNYGKSTIGNRADIERVGIPNLRAFYRKYYRPDNAMVVIAGKFEPETAIKLVEEYFGAIPQPETPIRTTYTEEPPQDGERFVTLRRVGDVAVVGSQYHIPSGPHPEFAAIDVLESALSMQPSGLLYKKLVETKKAASVSGATYALHDPGVVRFTAEVADDNDPRIVLENLIEIVEGVGETGIPDADVERAKQSLLKEVELTFTNSVRTALALSEWASQGDWRLMFLYRDRLEQVTPADVKSAAARYFRKNNRTVGMFLPIKQPDRVEIPSTPDLADMIGDYRGREDLAQGEAFDVSPANIESRTVRTTLPSGLKAAFLEKKTRGEAVNLRLTLRYGSLDTLRGLAKAAEYLPELMLRGTKSLTHQQIQDELNEHRAQLSASGSAGEATFTIQAKRSTLPAVLRVLQQVLREPTFPENELQTLQQAELAQLSQQLTDPTSLAMRKVSRSINPYEKPDPRHVPSVEEEIADVKALQVAELQSLYNNLLGAAHGEVAVVGDFDREQTEQLLAEMTSGWESKVPYKRIPRTRGTEVEGARHTIQTPGKANATYFAAEAVELRDDSPDYPPLVLGNYILGAGSLSSRLGDRVRQKEGLSYTVGSSLRASSLDKRTTLSVYAIANPDNMPKTAAAIAEEIDLLLEKGIRPDELARAKEGYLQRRQVARTDDSQLARILAETVETGRTMEFQQQLEERINAATPGQVNQALRKYIDPQRLTIVTAGDFKKTTDNK